mgnify:CR=1 FL=1
MLNLSSSKDTEEYWTYSIYDVAQWLSDLVVDDCQAWVWSISKAP